MSYMKKNVNFGLFLLVVATLICFAGFSVYYQKTYFNLTEEYKAKIEKIDNLVTTLSLEKTKLNQTSYQLKLKADREEDLSSKYTTLRDDKEQLEIDIAQLESELSQKKSELNQKILELASTQTSLKMTQDELSIANTHISQLNNQVSDLNDDIDSLEAQLAACTP
jgi:chromosome segregation ATPase